MGCGVGDGDAVVTVSHTFIATIEAISQAGAETEFVDVDERTYTMSPEALGAYLERCPKDAKTGRPLGRRTGKPITAIVPVHLYGQVADMGAILQLAERYGLMVVEDACQAHGAEYLRRRPLAARGLDGQGGRVQLLSREEPRAPAAKAAPSRPTIRTVARTVQMLRDHGQVKKYYHDLEGYNGRLDAIQAGLLRVKLRHLDAWNAERRAAARRYNELLAASRRRSGTGVVTPFEPEWSKAVYHLYVISAADADAMAQHLKASNIATGFHYPVPVHLQKCYRGWGYRSGQPARDRAGRLRNPLAADVPWAVDRAANAGRRCARKRRCARVYAALGSK